MLELKNNGGFPVIFSAKISNTIGELLMSYVGGDLFEEYNIEKSLEDPKEHQVIDIKTLSNIAMQTIS